MDVADLTLDELRLALAPGIADSAVFDGWSVEALDMAADQLGADRDVARLAFKDDGAMGMICAWIETIDRQMTLDLPPETLAAMKIRERIRSLVQYRLDAVAGQEEALRRALAIMAMPQNAPRALKTGWNSADVMCRRHRDRLQPLHQARDPRVDLRRDAGGLRRRPERGQGRDPRLSRPADRRSDEVREGEGQVAQPRPRDLQRFALPRTPALPRTLTGY